MWSIYAWVYLSGASRTLFSVAVWDSEKIVLEELIYTTLMHQRKSWIMLKLLQFIMYDLKH